MAFAPTKQTPISVGSHTSKVIPNAPQTSYEIYLCSPQPPPKIWLDFQLSSAPHGTVEQEEKQIFEIAKSKLSELGLQFSIEGSKVLHIREVRQDPNNTYSHVRSKIYLVLTPAGLLSLHDGESKGIRQVQQTTDCSTGDFSPMEIACNVIQSCQKQTSDLLRTFQRQIGDLQGDASCKRLTEEQSRGLADMVKSVGYIRPRLLYQKFNAIDDLLKSLGNSQKCAAELLDSTGRHNAFLEELCGIITDAAGGIVKVNSALVENLQLENDRRRDAWDRSENKKYLRLTGATLPTASALGIIQAFQISRLEGMYIASFSLLFSLGVYYALKRPPELRPDSKRP